MAQLAAIASPTGLRTHGASKSRRVPTVLAPALPALVLLAITTAGMIDPPRAGLVTQLHVPKVTTTVTHTVTPSSMPVTAR